MAIKLNQQKNNNTIPINSNVLTQIKRPDMSANNADVTLSKSFSITKVREINDDLVINKKRIFRGDLSVTGIIYMEDTRHNPRLIVTGTLNADGIYMLGGSIKAKEITVKKDICATDIDVKKVIRAGGYVSSATDLKARYIHADTVSAVCIKARVKARIIIKKEYSKFSDL